MTALSFQSMKICSCLILSAGTVLAAEPKMSMTSKSLSHQTRGPIAIANSDGVPPVPSATFVPAPTAPTYTPTVPSTTSISPSVTSGSSPWTSVPAASPTYEMPSYGGQNYGQFGVTGGYARSYYYGTPGGYEARVGSPYYYYAPQGGQFVVTGDPYYDHFGPGFHRHSLHGHYRFPYYNYRAPWYYPGRAVYNRDTNFAW